MNDFEIKQAKIPITVTVRPLENLKPHEEVVPGELSALSSSIRSDGVLRHPIIADDKTGIVLDGTHRLLALRQLRCRLAPVALVDYRNPTITIERWYRMIPNAKSDEVMPGLERLGLLTREESPADAARMLDARSAVAVIESDEGATAFTPRAPFLDTLEAVVAGFRVESALRENGHDVSYTDSLPDRLPEKTLILSTIKLAKSDVISTVKTGKMYPPKSTRHLIPSRPLGTRVPVDWLVSGEMQNTRRKLLDHLSRMKLTRLGEGSTIGSRRYMEEVFLFE